MKRSFVLGVAMTLMLTLAPTRLPAQTTGDFRGFVFDSSFYFGAHGMLFPAIAQDTFHLTFSQTYDGPTGLRRILDSTFWAGADTAPGQRWRDSMDRIYYNQAIDRDYRVIFSPRTIRWFTGEMTLAECWYGERKNAAGDPDSNHVFAFAHHIRSGEPDSIGGAITYDSVFNHHVWGVKVEASTPPRLCAIALNPGEQRKGAETRSLDV